MINDDADHPNTQHYDPGATEAPPRSLREGGYGDGLGGAGLLLGIGLAMVLAMLVGRRRATGAPA